MVCLYRQCIRLYVYRQCTEVTACAWGEKHNRLTTAHRVELGEEDCRIGPAGLLFINIFFPIFRDLPMYCNQKSVGNTFKNVTQMLQ